MNLRTTICRALLAMTMCVLVVGASAFDVRADGDSFRFAVTADSRGSSPDSPVNVRVLRQLINDMNGFSPVFCLFPGDLVFGGNVNSDGFKRELQEWLAATRDFRGTLYVAPGNHELRHWIGRDQAWRQMFPGMPSNGPGGEQEKCSYYVDYGASRNLRQPRSVRWRPGSRLSALAIVDGAVRMASWSTLVGRMSA